MRLRWQYSLSMLMLLTAVLSAIVAFVVIPWREQRRQEAIIERLEAQQSTEEHSFYLTHFDGGYMVDGVDTPAEFQFLVDHMQDSTRIRSIRLANHCANAEGVAKLRSLPNLEDLELSIARLDEPTMQMLQQMPLKRLVIDKPEQANFRTWPIQPRLESFRILINQEQMDIPSLRIERHANLQFLDVCLLGYSAGSLTAFSELIVQDSPKLEFLDACIGNSRAPCRFKIENLPELKKLALSSWPLATQNSINALPLVDDLRIDSDFIPFLTKVLGNDNLHVNCNNSSAPMKAEELNQLLHYENIRHLELLMGWSEFEEGQANLPRLAGLQTLKFFNHYAANGADTKPFPYMTKELALRFLAQAPNVEVLSLMVERADDELIFKIAGLEKLRELHLMVYGECTSLLPLRDCARLQSLRFSQHVMNQEFLNDLAELQPLDTLEISTQNSPPLDFSKLRLAPFKKILFNGKPIAQPLSTPTSTPKP